MCLLCSLASITRQNCAILYFCFCDRLTVNTTGEKPYEWDICLIDCYHYRRKAVWVGYLPDWSLLVSLQEKSRMSGIFAWLIDFYHYRRKAVWVGYLPDWLIVNTTGEKPYECYICLINDLVIDCYPYRRKAVRVWYLPRQVHAEQQFESTQDDSYRYT